MLRAGVAGCGRIGCGYDLLRAGQPPYSHAGGYQAHPGFELSGMCDPRAPDMEAIGRRWPGVPLFADCDEMFRQVDLDVVSIATPPGQRLAIAAAALANDVRAIFCEKPLAHDFEHGFELVRMCDEAEVPLLVNFSRRWDQGCRRAKSEIDKGTLGRINRVVGLYAHGLSNNGSHLIDLIQWWFGGVKAASRVTGPGTDSPDVTLVLGSGVRCELIALPADGVEVFELSVYGSDGLIRLEDFGETIQLHKKEQQHFAGSDVLGAGVDLKPEPEQTMLNALTHIEACVNGHAKPWCGGKDGLAVMQVLAELDAV